MHDNVEDISLEYLKGTDLISVRAMNVCMNNGLKGLNDIIWFHKRNGTFKKLKNCGYNTEKELNEICKKFSNHSMDGIIEKIKELDHLKELINEFKTDEIIAINQHIKSLILNLTVRASNGLLSLFNGVPHVGDLIEKIYSSSFSFHTIRNIGDKTVAELEDFKEHLLIFIKNFSRSTNEIIKSESIRPTIITDLDKSFPEVINDFNPFKNAALTRHIEYLISNLNVRARN